MIRDKEKYELFNQIGMSIDSQYSLFQGIVNIRGHKLKCVYIERYKLASGIIRAIAYNDEEAWLAVIAEEDNEIKKQIYYNLGFKLHLIINWDHLLYEPETFLIKVNFIHYSDKDIEVIRPITLNIGNKLSRLRTSSFWTLRGNYYSTSIYRDKTDECNIVFVFYRRLSKSIFPNSNVFIIQPSKDVKIYILKDFYDDNQKAIDDICIYSYYYETFGFFTSLGGEYSIKEYTFDIDVKPDKKEKIYLSEYSSYIEIVDKVEFDRIRQEVDAIFMQKHFCEIINSVKPDAYYDYDELVGRRKEIKEDRINKNGKYYSPRIDYDFDGIDILSDINITADLHIGKYFKCYKEVSEEIKSFWKELSLEKKHLLLMGDIIDADYLSKDELIKANKYFLEFAPKNTYLIMGNNDRLSMEDYIACGYRKVWIQLVFGKYIFTHMPVPCDSSVVNVHGHLHGRCNYINITPYNHIDVGYKANKFKVKILREYLDEFDKNTARTRQNIDIEELFENNELQIYEKYKDYYCISDCYREIEGNDKT